MWKFLMILLPDWRHFSVGMPARGYACYAHPYPHARDALLSSYRLARSIGHHYGIDDSHNHVHSKEVLFWAGQILQAHPETLHSMDRVAIGHCALLHDILDRKYIGPDSYDKVHEIVLHHLTHASGTETASHMMNVMLSMSYSKTVFPDPVNGTVHVRFPSWIDDKKTWSTIYHIVREADLLSAYNIARMVEYRRAKFPTMTESEMRDDIRQMFASRMSTMIERGLFVHPASARLASALCTVANLKMSMLDDIRLAPSDGGDVQLAPSEGGDVQLAPSQGGDKELLSEGGDKEPSSEGGDKEPSSEGGDKEPSLDILRCINTKWVPAGKVIDDFLRAGR